MHDVEKGQLRGLLKTFNDYAMTTCNDYIQRLGQLHRHSRTTLLVSGHNNIQEKKTLQPHSKKEDLHSYKKWRSQTKLEKGEYRAGDEEMAGYAGFSK